MPFFKKLSDAKLVKKVIEENQEWYEEIVKRYQPKLLRYAKYLTGDDHQAEDVVQEALIKAFVNLKGFNSNRGKFSSWIYRICHNEAVSLLKSEKKWVSMDKYEWLKESFAGKENVERDFLKKEAKKEVRSCLGKLAVDYRAVLSLFYLEDKKYEEIGEILKIPTGTVGVRLKRGKEKLKEICNNSGEV